MTTNGGKWRMNLSRKRMDSRTKRGKLIRADVCIWQVGLTDSCDAFLRMIHLSDGCGNRGGEDADVRANV